MRLMVTGICEGGQISRGPGENRTAGSLKMANISMKLALAVACALAFAAALFPEELCPCCPLNFLLCLPRGAGYLKDYSNHLSHICSHDLSDCRHEQRRNGKAGLLHLVHYPW